MLSLGLNQPDPQHSPIVDEPEIEIGPHPFATLQPPPLPARPPAVAFSGVIHVLSAICILALARASVMHPPATSATPASTRVFLPPPAALRALQGLPPLPRPRDTPRNRISIGAPSPEQRALVLRPEDDLTRAPQGERLAQGNAGQFQPEPLPQTQRPEESAPPDLASGFGDRDRQRPRLQVGNAIARAVASSSGRWGDAAGNQSGMGLQFDPEGADFSRWMQQFKDEVYRNWMVPQSVLWGWGGQVSFEFVVERSGAMTTLTTVSGSGTAALDRAAHNALTASRLLPLPDDYAPAQITMRVTFTYEAPPTTRHAQSTHSAR